MGKSYSRDLVISENEKRNIFIVFKSYRVEHSGAFGAFCVYTFVIRYRRFRWEFDVRYNELLSLERKLTKEFPDAITTVPKLLRHNKIFWTHDSAFLEERAKIMTKYMQDILDIDGITESVALLQVIGASKVSFSPELGPKGKEGYLKKSSGGYKEKFSRKAGDYFQVWTWRWFVLQDNCITWYKAPKDTVPVGALQIDQQFTITAVRRVIRLSTATRNLILYAPTERSAVEWTNALRGFYGTSSRVQKHPFESSYPPRAKCDVQVYSVTKEYYHAVALAMLGAQREILITDWKMSPSVLLTRPPLPPLRLDQLLKYKADQGVNIYVLLYKEVEHIGQGNDSGKVKVKLESLSPNIHVLRHPNKFFGGSTAMLWSHHEKLVVIDRNVTFVGGVDLAFQRWDDEKHRVTDEDGVVFPGHDYRQPAPAKHKPARSEEDAKEIQAMEQEEFIEVELALANENLPEAAISTMDDDGPYEVEVAVVDFGLPENSLPPPPQTLQAQQEQRRSDLLMSTQPPRAGGEGMEASGNVPEDFPDSVSEVSNNWAEDRFTAMSPEEQAAAQGEKAPESPTSPSLVKSGQAQTRGSIISEVKEGLNFAATNVSTTLNFFSESANTMYQSYVTTTGGNSKSKTLSSLEAREVYPKMGWHDIQAAISGRVARDVASHFVQRWNHHRLSTNSLNQPILHDTTDDIFFSVCAKCGKDKIHESVVNCPICNYDLGPPNTYSTNMSILRTPTDSSRFSWLVYEFQFDLLSKLPFRMEGDCPVVVTMLLPVVSGDPSHVDEDGVLVDVAGTMAEWLHAVGLRPSIGDVVLAVDGDVVTQLNSGQLRRLMAKKRRRAKMAGFTVTDASPQKVSILFRRHYLEDLHDTMVKGDPQGYMPLSAEQQEAANNLPLAAKLGALGVGYSGKMEPIGTPGGADNAAHTDIVASVPHVENDTTLLMSDDAHMDPAQRKIAQFDKENSLAPSSPVESNNAGAMMMEGTSSAVAVSASDLDHKDGTLVSPEVQAVDNAVMQIDQFHPACLAAAQKEIQLSISKLFHEHNRSVNQVNRLIDDSGTCVVQLLRSVGQWSVGTKVECSIMRCYIETIQNAHHFIYIENQFFIGNLAGEGVQNTIPYALAERILKAHSLKQPFKVIVVLPMHPNGDFVNAMKSKVVMHYEYLTINRGVNSLFKLLRNRAPDMNISDYIGFFSLRNWGLINNKIVSEQVYVHDKLMIVDDRVVIVGSANINDRSMLGNRDSEIAVRIEDTLHMQSTFNGMPFTVGYLPFMLRLRLMRQQVADDTIDFSDPLRPEVYKLWTGISQKNSSVYDELDGNMSVYRCVTINQYKQALEEYRHRSYLDADARLSLSEVKGFLVDWPANLFRADDLSPSLATRALIPDELWV